MCGGFFGCVYLPQVLLWRWFMWRIFFQKGTWRIFCIWRWLTAKTTTDPVKTAASLTSRTWWWSEGSHQKMWALGWLQKHCCRRTTGSISPRALFGLATVQRSDPVPLLVYLRSQKNRGGTSDWLGVLWHHKGLISNATCSCAHFLQH